MPKTETNDERLNNHSKRLAALEQAQVYFASQQSELLKDVQRIKEVLYGSDDPDEISIRQQLSETNKKVLETNDMIRRMMGNFDRSQQDTIQIRKDGFQRIADLERDNIVDWIRNHPKTSILIGTVFIAIFISDIRLALWDYVLNLRFLP